MTNKESIKIFEDSKIRTVWDSDAGKWYISIVDVIAVLTESANPQVYWRVLKKRLTDEGNETVTNCNALKMRAADGKMRKADVADIEQLFRLIQSIPSPKAEPFKLWLAQIASERIDEMQDPEITAEASTKDISQAVNPNGFVESKQIAKQGGHVAKVAREELESKTGQKVVTSLNAKAFLEEKKKKQIKE